MNAFGKASGGGRRGADRQTAPLMVLVSTLSRTLEAVLVDLSATGARITGGELPAEAFRWLMATLHQGKEPRDLGCKAPVRVAARHSRISSAE